MRECGGAPFAGWFPGGVLGGGWTAKVLQIT